jgi:hypothetical protein
MAHCSLGKALYLAEDKRLRDLHEEYDVRQNPGILVAERCAEQFAQVRNWESKNAIEGGNIRERIQRTSTCKDQNVFSRPSFIVSSLQ